MSENCVAALIRLFRDSEPHFDLDGVYCAAESIELFRFAYK